MNQMNSMMNQEQKVDYLKEDPQIGGQKFACVSFVEPTDQELLTDRESFFATKFLKTFADNFKTASDFLAKEGEEKMNDDIRKHLDLSYENIKSTFYEFRKLHLTKLQEDFEKQDMTREGNVMRGIKIRGTYPTYAGAQQRSKEMREFEPAHDVFVTQVGYWVPFNPQHMSESQIEYSEDALNNLVRSKVEESEKRDLAYEHRKMELMEKAAKDTEALKAKNALENIKEEELVEELDDEDIFEIVESDDEEDSEPTPEPKKQSKKSMKRRNKKIGNRRRVNRRRR
jgi:hypothetical protein